MGLNKFSKNLVRGVISKKNKYEEKKSSFRDDILITISKIKTITNQSGENML